jgi:hypothetical protein
LRGTFENASKSIAFEAHKTASKSLTIEALLKLPQMVVFRGSFSKLPQIVIIRGSFKTLPLAKCL